MKKMGELVYGDLAGKICQNRFDRSKNSLELPGKCQA